MPPPAPPPPSATPPAHADHHPRPRRHDDRPHRLAAEAGAGILRAGGNAAEAAVAIAAMLAAVYPHMTGIGGDSFWILASPGHEPIAIDASGRAAAAATDALYAGHAAIPWRGPLAANTVAGAVSGWQAALHAARHWTAAPLPLAHLLEPAIHHAGTGIAVPAGMADLIAAKHAALSPQHGFAAAFMPTGKPPLAGEMLRLPALAETLRTIATEGPETFYRGPLARRIASELAAAGSPVSLDDLNAHRAIVGAPLSVAIRGARLFNTPPPTQGVASLAILAIFDRLGVTEAESFAHIHGLVEATKQAFLDRDAHIGDPEAMTIHPARLLTDSHLDASARRIDMATALPWPQTPSGGDTTWFGAIDAAGNAVSAIQSTYFEFGSGVVLPSGIAWQNRGSSFALTGDGPRRLRPRARPFHTLNPAFARFADGRAMVYGTMGGEGQPQTQAALFTRHAMFGMDLQQAISAPRWLLGRTWGETSTTLKLENRFDPALVSALSAAGHDVELVGALDPVMGHAGAIVRHPDGHLEGATDPRSDGAAVSAG